MLPPMPQRFLPAAACCLAWHLTPRGYGGHQFGNWAGQLGDGRAITLGETIGPDGQRRELQLKGSWSHTVLTHGRRPRGAAVFGT